MFKYQPIPDDELHSRDRFFAEGKADFEFRGAQNTLTKKDKKPMLVLELQVWDKNHKEGAAKVFITESMTWMLHQFLRSIGHEDDYKTGIFDPDKYMGKGGELNIKYKVNAEGIEQRNFTFLKPSAEEKTAEFFNDEIPF